MVRVAVLPRDFPKEFLSPEKLTETQEAIMYKALKGWKSPLVFSGVTFRPGLLISACKDDCTVEWLAKVIPTRTANHNRRRRNTPILLINMNKAMRSLRKTG